MPNIDCFAAKSALREAMARDAYARGDVRIADPDLAGQTWLIARTAASSRSRPMAGRGQA